MQHAKRMLVAGLAALGCATASAAQEAPRVDPTELPLSEGRRALAAREYDAASGHFLRALEHAPDDPEILALLIEASVGDDDARALWSHALWARLVDERGRARPTREQRELFDEEDASIEELGAARAAAVRELNDLMENRERLARRSPEQRLVLAWARALAWQLAAPAPALRADSPPLLELPDDLALGVIDDLRRAAETALARRSPEEAVRYAAILRGLGAQARFNDLIGEAPRGSAQLEAEGQGLLDRARGTLGPRLEEPWTLDELEYLTEEEGEAFTRDHDSLERPGRSISPTGLYRIETPCGYETLVGVTRTVEDHHRRLVNFFGRDPFEGVPGQVRVLPEANGLEREGTPFWWAGGFQRGDETVLRFSTGTIEGFGHGLTHELTHRFDGAIYPGQPSWLVEGKAVWTGAAFGNSWDAEFIPDHASFGTIEAAFIDGYGGGRKLRQLIEGSIADYRDNYTAGYALYVYLSSWEEGGRALFAEPLVRYMQSAASDRREPIARFEAHFADGLAGRPRDFDAFSEAFGEFVRGFYWQNRADWTSRYTRETGAVGSGYVYDDPTWVWTRERSEPVFGLDHAREAGLLFSELGLREQAVRALLWSLSIDGLDPRVQLALEAQLEDEDARWALERLRRGLYTSAQTAAPFPRELEATMAYAEALRASAEAYDASARPHSAAALRADAARLELSLGQSPALLEAPPEGALRHPYDPPARPLSLHDWSEDLLVGYEERRAAGAWYADERGDLHVGRQRPRSGTGSLDRNARQRHAFARSNVWLEPGAYRVKARVQFTTSYSTGAVVIGYERRDRHLRFHFNAGDFLYSIGQSEEEPVFDGMGWSLRGPYEREGALSGSRPGGRVDFAPPTPSFELELVVDGSALFAYVNGEYLGTYHDPFGVPIQGYVGFATSNGAIRVQRPRVERLDRSLPPAPLRSQPTGLDLVAQHSLPFGELVRRRVRGLPERPNGQLLLWIPAPPPEDDGAPPDLPAIERRARRSIERMAEMSRRELAPQTLTVALPAMLGEERLALIAEDLAEIEEPPIELIVHELPPEGPDGGKRWILFIDPYGIARVATLYLGRGSGFDDKLKHWLRVFREHGRPERALPEYGREELEDELEGEG